MLWLLICTILIHLIVECKNIIEPSRSDLIICVVLAANKHRLNHLLTKEQLLLKIMKSTCIVSAI